MASRHKNPGRFPNDKFPKTLYKIVSVKSTPAKKLPDTLVGVRQFLCGGRFDAYPVLWP